MLKPYLILLFFALCLAVAPVRAAVITLTAGSDLQQAVERAQAGDVLHLASGRYRGPVVIDKPLTLAGPSDRSAVIDGGGRGRTVSITAPDSVLRHLTVTGSGIRLDSMDAGIFLDKTAHRAVVEENNISGNAFGVYVWGANDAVVRANRIVGDSSLRVNERGNGVNIWNAAGTEVSDNLISQGRDGIFSNASTKNTYKNNHFSKLRYAVHYMYTNDSEISGNISDGNQIGYALMFSERLKIRNNIAVNSSAQGMMLNYANHSDISGNVVDKAEKCVFIYNANHNRITDNYFGGCGIGIHFTAAAEGNTIHSNAFVSNQNQIKYVSTRYADWGESGRGNYWSDNSAFDLDGDGIADTAYRPNGITDQILWRAPAARLLMNSPAVSMVKWAQAQFPALLPGGITDSRPLMLMPHSPTWQRYQTYKQNRQAA